MRSPADANLQSWMLAVILYEDNAGDLRVFSMEMAFDGVKHRLNFDKKNRLWDVFTTEIASEIMDVIGRMGPETHLFTDPDYEISHNGTKLAGLRAMRWTDKRKGRQVIVRFKYFMGGVDRLLRARVPFTRSLLDHREKIAIEALSDITTPLLNIATIPANMDITQEQRETIEAKLAVISDRASDLQFYISLLTRYVRECAEDLPLPSDGSDVVDVQVAPRALKG